MLPYLFVLSEWTVFLPYADAPLTRFGQQNVAELYIFVSIRNNLETSSHFPLSTTSQFSWRRVCDRKRDLSHTLAIKKLLAEDKRRVWREREWSPLVAETRPILKKKDSPTKGVKQFSFFFLFFFFISFVIHFLLLRAKKEEATPPFPESRWEREEIRNKVLKLLVITTIVQPAWVRSRNQMPRTCYRHLSGYRTRIGTHTIKYGNDGRLVGPPFRMYGGGIPPLFLLPSISFSHTQLVRWVFLHCIGITGGSLGSCLLLSAVKWPDIKIGGELRRGKTKTHARHFISRRWKHITDRVYWMHFCSLCMYNQIWYRNGMGPAGKKANWSTISLKPIVKRVVIVLRCV